MPSPTVSRRGFVMIGAALAASIPFLNAPQVAEATEQLDRARPKPAQGGLVTAPTIPLVGPEVVSAATPNTHLRQNLDVLVPSRVGEFYVGSVDIVHGFAFDDVAYGDDWRAQVVGLRDVTITLRASGPINLRALDQLMSQGDPVELWVPQQADQPQRRRRGRLEVTRC